MSYLFIQIYHFILNCQKLLLEPLNLYQNPTQQIRIQITMTFMLLRKMDILKWIFPHIKQTQDLKKQEISYFHQFMQHIKKKMQENQSENQPMTFHTIKVQQNLQNQKKQLQTYLNQKKIGYFDFQDVLDSIYVYGQFFQVILLINHSLNILTIFHFQYFFSQSQPRDQISLKICKYESIQHRYNKLSVKSSIAKLRVFESIQVIMFPLFNYCLFNYKNINQEFLGQIETIKHVTKKHFSQGFYVYNQRSVIDYEISS
ncbi:unnamed protein product [Paramecium octaurelia]|uniref:Uncharacterized protein n=1 Tax=Paramecium octaurelia TaxID=43137 RepID=A0A8S1XSA7_PAROT|nr:unnamed protein product [Paramecium octaurelia]